MKALDDFTDKYGVLGKKLQTPEELEANRKREIWTAETLMYALEVCEDDRLKLTLNLAFSCSLRMGEMLGLPNGSQDGDQ